MSSKVSFVSLVKTVEIGEIHKLKLILDNSVAFFYVGFWK